MNRSETAGRAKALRKLHEPGELVVVPNAFDAASAKVLEVAGFATVATSSGAMAWTAGYADGEALSFDQALELHARVARAVDVPVSFDFEGGYVGTSGGIEATIEALIGAGVAGVGLEDTNFDDSDVVLHEAEVHAELIAAAREAADRLGTPLFINGRTDLYFRGVGEPEERADEAARRLNLYAAAGADCLFAPGIADPAEIELLAGRLDGPLNVVYRPGMPSIDELGRLGVGRLTFGVSFYLAALSAVETAAQRLRANQVDGLAGATKLSRESRQAFMA
jgi:2-methylisocitrate lyase-like PEP mutase family enzyme